MDYREAWPRCPEAAAFFEQQMQDFVAANPRIGALSARLLGAGVNILNLVDHWTLPETSERASQLAALGLVERTTAEGDCVWEHPGARLPRVRLKKSVRAPRLALAVEDIPLFAQQNDLELETCHGDPDSTYQCAHLTLEAGELMPITRQGYNGFAPGTLSAADALKLTAAREALLQRDRTGSDDEVLSKTQTLIETIIEQIGQDRATDEFFASERVYYMSRNRAASWQYEAQQKLGIGWANHDHHTYRCSRAGFRAMIRLWHTLGFVSRERFYAGAEAGWGAQVLEHPVSRVVIFADVDMAPEELDVDYANVDLPPRETLGTIGLWCGLHGDSLGAAGMHHLEAEFDFARVQAALEAAGHAVMPPFTDLPMLKQAFTVAEIWPVAPERIQALLARDAITPEQAERFRVQGAAGSHLEILQRWEGFKGFNKTGVSAIIRDTDARRN